MATVILSIGVPGSGKSSLLKKISERAALDCFGPDSIRSEKWNDETDHSDDKAIWIELRERAAVALRDGRSIIIDSTFHTAKRRAHFIDFVRSVGADCIEGLYFNIPLEELLSRSLGRANMNGKQVSGDYVRKAYVELQENIPTLEEGFDVLFTIDEAGNVTKVSRKSEGVLATFFNDKNV